MGRFQNNTSIGWVHAKSTHACLLIWGNKNVCLGDQVFRPLLCKVKCL
jgi:hypothetical protein